MKARIESQSRSAPLDETPSEFDARCEASLEEYRRTGVASPADVVLDRLEARVKAKVAAKLEQLRKRNSEAR